MLGLTKSSYFNSQVIRNSKNALMRLHRSMQSWREAGSYSIRLTLISTMTLSSRMTKISMTTSRCSSVSWPSKSQQTKKSKEKELTVSGGQFTQWSQTMSGKTDLSS